MVPATRFIFVSFESAKPKQRKLLNAQWGKEEIVGMWRRKTHKGRVNYIVEPSITSNHLSGWAHLRGNWECHDKGEYHYAILSCSMAQLWQAALNYWFSVLLRSSYRIFGGDEGGGLQFSKLGWRRGVTHILAPCLWLRRKPSITSVPLHTAVPQCTVSDFNTWSTLSPALTQTSMPSYAPPTNPFCVIWGFSLFSVQTKSKLNVWVARKGKGLLVTDSSCRQSSWSTNWLRQ